MPEHVVGWSAQFHPAVPFDFRPEEILQPATQYSALNRHATSNHVQPNLDSLAYRLDSSEGSVVLTGDTQPCQSVFDLTKGADMLLYICWDDQGRMIANGEAIGQCGTIDAARMARPSNVKKLVLVHVGAHLASHGPMEKGMTDIRRIFDGEVVFAEELMSLQVR